MTELHFKNPITGQNQFVKTTDQPITISFDWQGFITRIETPEKVIHKKNSPTKIKVTWQDRSI